MEVKWFFVIFGLLFTFAIVSSQLLIGTYLNKVGDTRFDNSTTVHNFLYKAINKTTGMLDPLLEQIPNATDSKLKQDMHYNQTTEDFKNIAKILQIKLQDHIILGVLNQSITKILEILNSTSGTNGTIISVPVPVINNMTEKPIIDDRGLSPLK